MLICNFKNFALQFYIFFRLNISGKKGLGQQLIWLTGALLFPTNHRPYLLGCCFWETFYHILSGDPPCSQSCFFSLVSASNINSALSTTLMYFSSAVTASSPHVSHSSTRSYQRRVSLIVAICRCDSPQRYHRASLAPSLRPPLYNCGR